MEKMFKRSVLGAAVTLAAVSGGANAAIELAGEAVQVYGQAAGFVHIVNPTNKTVGGVTENAGDSTISTEIESRIGFKGIVEFDQIAPDLVWQVESGNATNGGGSFGVRDTFVGFNFEGIGSIKYGRQLVAAYNYVDWPHSNPGLGDVFDYNNDIDAAFEDRADNVIRFDSANFGGFNFQATVSGMGDTANGIASSIAGSFTQDIFSVHAGYYDRASYSDGTTNYGDMSYFIVGGSLYLEDITLSAAFKPMRNKIDGFNLKQNAYSLTAQYLLDETYVFKLGYAATTDADGYAVKLSDGDSAITGRLGYLLPSAYLYFDVRNYEMAEVNDTRTEVTKTKATNFLIGAEYYF